MLAPPTALVSVRRGTAGEDRQPRIISVLTLVAVTSSHDSGDYSCTAENTAGRAEMTFKLTVTDAPAPESSVDAASWSGYRDAFLGTVVGLLTVACVVVLCTVLQLRAIAARRRRLRGKNAINHVDVAGYRVSLSPTANHRAPADVETATALDDDGSRSSEERSLRAGSPLLANHHYQRDVGCGRKCGQWKRDRNDVGSTEYWSQEECSNAG